MASWCARCVQWLREISLYTTCCCPKLAPPRKSCLEMRLQPASSRILSLSLSLSLEECRRLFQQPTSLYTEHKNTTPRPRDSRIRGGSGKGIFGSRSKFTDHDSTVASSTVSRADFNMPQKRQRRAPRVNTTPVTDQAGKTEAKTLQDLLNPEPTAEARACFAATATPALRSERFFRAPHRLTRAARAAPRTRRRTRHPS